MLKRLTALTAGMCATTAVATAVATAAPATPNGYCGAANMVNPNALPGMINAMFGNGAGGGNAEMFAAVARTACNP